MSKTNTCPQCGEAASGNFCANCGASLGGRFCNQCGAKASPGASFCNECGASLSAGVGTTASGAGAGGGGARSSGGTPGGKPGGGSRVGAQAARARAASGGSGGGNAGMGWWVAGGMFVVIIFFMVLPLLTQEEQQQSTVPNAPFAQGGAAAAPATTDLSSMTPREAADRLYERVMRAASASDSAQVNMFLPMSLQAYDMARPLDADGLFHLSRLQRMASRDSDALNTAVEGLEINPNHLLNLYAAGDAALALGQEDQARAYLSRLLQAWDVEMASGNPDYQLHANMMPEVRAFAEQNVGG